MARKPFKFTTAPVVEDSNRPKLRSTDLSRSHQWPFHLRVHPDRWEYVHGEWRLEIERAHLRPGVGGVKGKHGDVTSICANKLVEAWAEHGDRRWVLVVNGDKRIDANGFDFMESTEVCVEENGRLREGSVIIATWEVIDDAGDIVNDDAKLNEVSKLLASKLWGFDGPTPAARRRVAGGLKKTLDKLCSTAARRPGTSIELMRRINKLKAKYAAVTGQDYDDGMPKAAPPAAPTASTEMSLLQQLLSLPADERAGVLAALAPAPPPVRQKPQRKKKEAPNAR